MEHPASLGTAGFRARSYCHRLGELFAALPGQAIGIGQDKAGLVSGYPAPDQGCSRRTCWARPPGKRPAPGISPRLATGDSGRPFSGHARPPCDGKPQPRRCDCRRRRSAIQTQVDQGRQIRNDFARRGPVLPGERGACQQQDEAAFLRDHSTRVPEQLGGPVHGGQGSPNPGALLKEAL